MNETDKQFYKRLGINHDSKRCEKRWQQHHNKIITDMKEHCKGIWEKGSGNFASSSNKPIYNLYWEEWT